MKICTYLLAIFLSLGALFFAYNLEVMASDNFNDVNYDIPLTEIDPIGQTGGGIDGGVGALRQILENVADILLFTIPILAGIALLVAGYFYIFSGGQSDMVGKAKIIIKWNLIALLVAFFSYGIITIIASFF
ncbi:hypothetical protein CSB09_00845 [Candidatus Gracilibacteria bacterium]|nr:MAG: hypothetical protein CSB09_00845 [Candidatus Gracilibacteria bacterium]